MTNDSDTRPYGVAMRLSDRITIYSNIIYSITITHMRLSDSNTGTWVGSAYLIVLLYIVISYIVLLSCDSNTGTWVGSAYLSDSITIYSTIIYSITIM